MKMKEELIIQLYELNDKLTNLISLMKSHHSNRQDSAQQVSQFLPYSKLLKHVNRHLN